jgi:hypothetical protein
MNDELEMAERFFGFGRWDAPYWFIGPEPGGSNNDIRARVWKDQFGKGDLLDCKAFHDALVGAMREKGIDPKSIDKVKKLVRESPKPALQPTWRRLILLLKANRDENYDLAIYQRDFWGHADAKTRETCVIELLGLPAKGLMKRNEEEDHKRERANRIRGKILENGPEFVVMYGRSEENYWKLIAGPDLPRDKVVKLGPTKFIFLPHPNDFGRTDKEWITWGENLQ